MHLILISEVTACKVKLRRPNYKQDFYKGYMFTNSAGEDIYHSEK